jgi:glucose/arabinose dehydrogenase
MWGALRLILSASTFAFVSPGGLTVPAGFGILTVASVSGARELVALPNGDLIAGTRGSDVVLVAGAEGASPVTRVLLRLPDPPASGVAYSQRRGELFVGTENAVYAVRYVPAAGRVEGDPVAIARVRTGGIPPGSDGDVHRTTSVAFDDERDTLYVSVGSSCNACTEIDPTRSSIFAMRPDGSGVHKIARRIRNGIALAIDPQTHDLWVGDAGQDALPFGHPYEFADNVSSHRAVADYGWPECEENHHAYVPGARCDGTVIPQVELPAYATIIGAAFYPAAPRGRFAFPSTYRGGLFLTAHGSWHRGAFGSYATEPMVAFVPMKGGAPLKGVDWNDPRAQWSTFAGGFQGMLGRRGRPTGIAVGSEGSLFIADDMTGVIYRVRPKE